MEVYLDGEQVAVNSELSFQMLTEQLKAQVGPHRVISDVKLGERFVGLEEEDKLSSKSISSFQEPLEFFSKNIKSLLKESLELAPQVCEALLLDCKDVRQFFEEGNLESAHERIGEISSLVDWLLQCIVSIQSYGGLDLKTLAIEEGSLIDSVRSMERVLKDLHQKLSVHAHEDFQALLMGEFCEHIQLWKKLFEKASGSASLGTSETP